MPRPRFNRILLKLSGEALMGDSQFGIDPDTVARVAREIADVAASYELCLVVGGGNIFRGLAAAAKGFDRTSADYMGMLATVMNALAVQNALEGVLERQAVHHGREHPDVVARRPVHARRGGRQAAEDVAAADDDPDLDAPRVDLRHLAGDERAELGVDAVGPVAQERLAGQLQQDPVVAEPVASCRGHRRFAHSSSPSA